MDDYEAFCLTDPVFYDLPVSGSDGDEQFLGTLDRAVPAGWRCFPMDIWTVVHCDGATLPMQGWKIHVSARPSNAARVLRQTWDYCIGRRMCFKFLSTRTALLAQNAKYADRSGSGKFVAIYPVDEAELRRTLHELGAILRGEAGPYILSDLRWEDGPLYVRYGGFVERQCRDDAGEPASAIEDPDGRLVPDVRQPVFRTPAWVELPDCLKPAFEQFTAEPAEPFSYQVSEALHYSNGGGVYLAEDPRTGQQVVLKEARPLAGLDGEGADAVDRLDREHRILHRLQGLECVPGLVDYLAWWEHRYLVEEHVEGVTISEAVVRRHPLLTAEPTTDQMRDYTHWAIGVGDEIDRAVRSIHDRGVIFGDLHPHNVIIRPDGRVALVDFELASHIDEARRPSLGAPGFSAPPDRAGFDIDHFSAACLRLALFLPLTQLLRWDPDKLDQLVEAIERRFPVPPRFGAGLRRDLAAAPAARPAAATPAAATPAAATPAAATPRAAAPLPAPQPATAAGRATEAVWPTRGLPAWAPVRDAIAAGIVASATPHRNDRLYPGDPAQFTDGGLGFAYGAAGVLWALHTTGAGAPADHVGWLVRALQRTDGIGPGFYHGRSGIAFALDALGRGTEANALLDTVGPGPFDSGDPTLWSGLAGIGLTLLDFADRHESPRYLEQAKAVAGHVLAALDGGQVRLRHPGLMLGWSGVALFLIRLYERTADPALLAAATTAIRRDLDGCVWTADRTLQVDEGWRVLPYLNIGSAGIGIVLHELLAHQADEHLLTAQDGIRRAALGDLVIYSGLFNGRAGLMLYLQAVSPGADEIVAHVESLAWHAVAFRGHLAFVGDQLLRLSMDLATGSAGVLLALGAVLADRAPGLPFLRSKSPMTGDNAAERRAPSIEVLHTPEGGDFPWLQSSSSRR